MTNIPLTDRIITYPGEFYNTRKKAIRYLSYTAIGAIGLTVTDITSQIQDKHDKSVAHAKNADEAKKIFEQCSEINSKKGLASKEEHDTFRSNLDQFIHSLDDNNEYALALTSAAKEYFEANVNSPVVSYTFIDTHEALQNYSHAQSKDTFGHFLGAAGLSGILLGFGITGMLGLIHFGKAMRKTIKTDEVKSEIEGKLKDHPYQSEWETILSLYEEVPLQVNDYNNELFAHRSFKNREPIYLCFETLSQALSDSARRSPDMDELMMGRAVKVLDFNETLVEEIDNGNAYPVTFDFMENIELARGCDDLYRTKLVTTLTNLLTGTERNHDSNGQGVFSFYNYIV